LRRGAPARRLPAGCAAPHAAERWDRRGVGPFHGRRWFARWAYATRVVGRAGGGAYPPVVRRPMLLGVGPPLGSAAGQPGIPAPAAGPCFEAATGRRHDCFLRDMAEDKASWRARVRDKACHTVAALKEELNAERARWQQLEQANTKLMRQLAEARSSAKHQAQPRRATRWSARPAS